MQAHARVCKANKLELEENDTYWCNFVVKGVNLKEYIGTVGKYQDDISKDN